MTTKQGRKEDDMRGKYYMADAERDVMEVIWRFPEGINQSRLLEQVNETGKDWKRQTLNTIVTRLMDKELVSREKRHVCALMTKEEYCNIQIEEVIDDVYDGKFTNLVIAFTKRNKISSEEAVQLQKLLEDYENGVN